ncbi:dimethylarginine dimethylaminohydrolase family protein [Legionella jamestowniensis]|uniref:N(G),N(G)-dimethylarginine dimethylaminohydrolase n=1 Tax=Legionella jamestowniensis TaxID=455 RepID=A0A0W0UGI9_9GAMM|nr:arginine deiminase family protein [Legionella jamestowniensis]KTD07035.1 NG,NG-dimethylarginine dimethylaminohydrolase [Legionella jamestowniensis]OCH96736.1 N(G),N(G)-dimethylarginine dimethylaminohydrolase [Legionella jamestowniensis]SFM03450.1 dimethylargininase [Legionella jamestowniensis DSM 19215]
MFFKNAIVRTPNHSLLHGLTSSSYLGKPDYPLALIQHQAYINALINCGVEVTVLPALEQYPDACFVEDVALLTEKIAVLTCPGAPSRQGEVNEIKSIIQSFYSGNQAEITLPGTLEAGDVLRIENHFYIGLSARTNKEGAQQLLQILSRQGFIASCIHLKEFLHLKTGVSYLGNNCIIVSGELINHSSFSQFTQLVIDPDEAYAANCIAVNGTVLIPQGFPKTKKAIQDKGFAVLTVDVSEFRKIDGGLSCLSLRF